MPVEGKLGAEPTEKRSSKDEVSKSFGEVESEYEATASKLQIQPAAPDANASAAKTGTIEREYEMPRPDGTLSAFDAT